ncbi:hypothetical protein [Kribbella sp. NBC_00359]|uniref:hypothetical protein n=1 Tax=Kribbella sp. NBC_00359 TaxID=2975966 RepID=UPI002E1E9E49
MKKGLAAQPDQPATLDQLQARIDTFVDTYNHTWPHRSLPHRATPATAYQARPKAGPSSDRSTDTHHRVLHDIADPAGKLTLRRAGRLHHISIGTEHARTPVLKLVDDLHIRIVNAATGELLRELTLDYQPLGRPPGPPKKQKPDPS